MDGYIFRGSSTTLLFVHGQGESALFHRTISGTHWMVSHGQKIKNFWPIVLLGGPNKSTKTVF